MARLQRSLRKLPPDPGAFPRILTDDEEPRISAVWWRRTHFRPEIVGGEGLVSDLLAGFRLLRLSKNYDVVVVTSTRKGNIYAILSGLCPLRRTPILMLDCLWYQPRNRFLRWLKRLHFKLTARAVKRFVVWASHEVHDYVTAFGIPEEKFLYVPYHHSLEGYEYEVSPGGYIFSGGDGDRDYPTFIEAVRGLGVKVVIATRRTEWCDNISLPPEVEVFPTTHADFREWMSGSAMVVVPMKKGLLHSGGATDLPECHGHGQAGDRGR